MSDDIARAVVSGAVNALRRRAARQAEIARLGTSAADGRPNIQIRTGEAAIALRLAGALAEIADDIEAAR